MEKFIDDSVLDELYETRSNGFESAFYIEHKEIQEEIDKQYYKLIEQINKTVEDKNDREMILQLVEEYADSRVDKENFWSKEYYKFGFSDACRLKSEAKDYLAKVKKD